MVRRVRGSRSKSDRHTGWASLSGGAKGDGRRRGLEAIRERCVRVGRGTPSTPGRTKLTARKGNHSRWVSHSRGNAALGCAEPTHKRRVKYLMFFEGKARSRRGDLLALRGKGAVPPVQPAPVSVVVVGSLLWFARITGESTRR